jgi:hypothetical protein
VLLLLLPPLLPLLLLLLLLLLLVLVLMLMLSILLTPCILPPLATISFYDAEFPMFTTIYRIAYEGLPVAKLFDYDRI